MSDCIGLVRESKVMYIMISYSVSSQCSGHCIFLKCNAKGQLIMLRGEWYLLYSLQMSKEMPLIG